MLKLVYLILEILIGAGVQFYFSGYLNQGYWREGLREYYGRWQNSIGDSYTGGYRRERKHGKGVYKWADGRCEIAHRVDGRKEGEAKFINKNGKERKRVYRNNRLVINNVN